LLVVQIGLQTLDHVFVDCLYLLVRLRRALLEGLLELVAHGGDALGGWLLLVIVIHVDQELLL